ncbi:hypothetical protein MuYL_1903 [Mucilaginibacter xinganensis]|uniref:Uncharacterized protein n=1 Tax=Mucilaginibacter xinganensis TaxID=1234841 RepID=A0A223NV84_9SPHI|nr:hypothetical protein MuYL_1903 [Mucilaginibacter xinganensis]
MFDFQLQIFKSQNFQINPPLHPLNPEFFLTFVSRTQTICSGLKTGPNIQKS